MTRAVALLLAVLLGLGPVATPAAEEAPATPEVHVPAMPTGPAAALERLRAEIDEASGRGIADTEMRERLAQALEQALTIGDRAAALALGTRSLAAARAAGTPAERATALNDHAAALDGVDRGREAELLRAEALALIEQDPSAIPILDRITFYANLAIVERRSGDVRAATSHALAAAELLLSTTLPEAEADRWTKTLLDHGREATRIKDPKARDLRIAVIRYASRAGTGEPASAFKAALDNAVAICGERPDLARDLVLDTIRGPRFGPWLALHRVKFIEDLDLAGAKWGLTGSLAASSEEGRTIRRPLLDLLEAAIALLEAADGSLPPEAEMLLRRALYTGSITRDYDRALKAGRRAVDLIVAQPQLDGKALADAHATLGDVYVDTERFAEARAVLADAEDLARRTKNQTALRSALHSRASLERKTGTPASTAAAYGALLAELDPRGAEAAPSDDPLVAAMTAQLGVEAAAAWVGRSIALEEMGRVDEAEFGYRRSLELSKRAGDTATFAVNAPYLVLHYRNQGRLSEARALAEEVIGAVGRDRAPTMLLSVEANVLVSKALTLPVGAERTRLLEQAAGFVATAEERRAGSLDATVAMERADDLRLLAEIERISGRPERAAAIYATLIDGERAQTPARPLRLSLLLLDRAVLSIESGRPEAALPDLAEAKALAPVGAGDVLSAGARASTLVIEAEALARTGRGTEALAAAREAADLARVVVGAADGGRFSSSEETRKTMARVFQKSVRTAWQARR
jgi:tetratricopeptide (TPR) repeat protein